MKQWNKLRVGNVIIWNGEFHIIRCVNTVEKVIHIISLETGCETFISNHRARMKILWLNSIIFIASTAKAFFVEGSEDRKLKGKANELRGRARDRIKKIIEAPVTLKGYSKKVTSTRTTKKGKIVSIQKTKIYPKRYNFI